MSSGERPIGASKGKQPNTEALCHPPPPRPTRNQIYRWYLRHQNAIPHVAVSGLAVGG